MVCAEEGTLTNRYPLDPIAVVRMLEDGDPRPGSEAAVLAADIARDGIVAGDYWWARIERRSAP